MIGLFDSGYGGLTVLKPVLEKLPQYDYIYLGDNARTPYGTRTPETIKRYSEQAVEYLFDRGCRLIIIACNTVSALALRHLQQKYLRDKNIADKKILGVIRPLAEYATTNTNTKRISVVGTRGTIASNAYEIELKKLDPDINVFSKACPLLVSLIEEHWHHKPEAKKILKKYLLPLKSKNSDTLILGCTHYPLMYKDFKRYMGKNVNVLKSGEIIAESLKDYLNRHPEIEKLITQGGTREYVTTDSADSFKKFGNEELSLSIDTVKTDVIW
ncbi:glutamate racemase [bacterium]|nr:glutamate racemase [bacterium]